MDEPRYPARPVLIVDDEPIWLRSLHTRLKAAGITNVRTCGESAEVMGLLEKSPYSVVALDLTMPSPSGAELLPQIVEAYPDIPTLIVSGGSHVETAVASMKQGAFDYIVKTADDERLIPSIRRAIEVHELRHEVGLLREGVLEATVRHPEAFAGIVTASPAMQKIFRYVESVAPTARPVLITGESGTGKELIARALHALSGREGPFVAVNVAGVDETAFTDTLFGHVAGAYTGAVHPRKGLVETAASGTLFLDEIGDLGAGCQVKLLRLLQEREYFPLGSDSVRLSTARIVVATNLTLEALERGGFRHDLYYRLSTHWIHVPPLRERREDIPLLLEDFLDKASQALGKARPTPPPELVGLLQSYHFPGNVRELESMVFDAVSHHHSHKLSMARFKEQMGGVKSPAARRAPGDVAHTVFPEKLPTLREASEELIAEAMRRAGNNQSVAARLLGITRQALNKRLIRSSQSRK